MQKTLALLQPIFTKLAPGQTPDKKEIQQALSADPEVKKQMQHAMGFADAVLVFLWCPLCSFFKVDFKTSGMSALDLKMPFDEKSFLEESLEFVRKSIGVPEVTVEYADENDTSKGKPGKPSVFYSWTVAINLG